MRMFLCEYITGGGMAGRDIPPHLAREGDMMLRAMLRDASALGPGASEIVTCRDRRLPPLAALAALAAGEHEKKYKVATVDASAEAEAFSHWRALMEGCEAVWLLAPESGGALLRLTALAQSLALKLLSCDVNAVRAASSKRRCATLLARAGVPCAPTWTAQQAVSSMPAAGVVAKPDDGAGCRHCRRFTTVSSLNAWLEGDPSRCDFLFTPWLNGESLSATAVFAGANARLLTCNRQHVVEAPDGTLSLTALEVGVTHPLQGLIAEMVEGVAAAIPGLRGVAGVDFMLDGRKLHVLDVNPRLTTSYAGLARALRRNPARMILDAALASRLPLSVPAATPIRLSLRHEP